MHALASGIVDGSIDLESIRAPEQSTEELFASYRELPGIGPYGAAHLLAMDGRHDFIAVDTEFRRFVRERYHGGRKIADKTMLRRYAKWGRWKYLAYWSEIWDSLVSDRPAEEKGAR
jgi:endonuclease III